MHSRPVLAAMLVALASSPSQEKPKQAPPQALYAIQLAVDAGKTTKLTVRGVGVESSTEVRIGEPKSTGRVLGKGKKVAVPNQMNAQVVGDSEIEIEVTFPSELPGGVVPVSLVGPGGEGKPMQLLVNDDSPRVPEKEPNDGFKEAMAVKPSIVVEATFKQNQDVDVYRLDAKAGEKYRIEVLGRRFGSPADAMITLFDSAGRTLATADYPTGSPDPVIRFTVPKDGTYFISAIEGYDQGGANFVYRLAVRRE